MSALANASADVRSTKVSTVLTVVSTARSSVLMPLQLDKGPMLQRMIDLVGDVAWLADRWAVAVLDDVLQPTTSEIARTNDPSVSRRREPSSRNRRLDLSPASGDNDEGAAKGIDFAFRTSRLYLIEVGMDTLSVKQRSERMSRVRCADTKPEMIVRSLLHRMGYRFRLRKKGIPGKPDVVLPKWRTVVLIHGCFWHRHPGCPNTRTSKSKIDFWTSKFDQNVRRDAEVLRLLTEANWRVLVIWECELKDLGALETRIAAFMTEVGACDRLSCLPGREG